MVDEQSVLRINKKGWDEVADQFFEGEKVTLSYGPYAPTEEELQLIGDSKDSTILEIGCGSGHTLQYLSKRGARELWGVDLSSKQIQTAREVLTGLEIPITLIEAPMEEIPGLPQDYFDLAISIYALGWTSNLRKTLRNIHGSLKSGGRFIFSWEHPIHSSQTYEDGMVVMSNSYLQEGSVRRDSWRGVPIVMNHRTVSTFINELIHTGFVIDKVVEESRIADTDESKPTQWYSAARAKITPSTLIIKCHKA